MATGTSNTHSHMQTPTNICFGCFVARSRTVTVSAFHVMCTGWCIIAAPFSTSILTLAWSASLILLGAAVALLGTKLCVCCSCYTCRGSLPHDIYYVVSYPRTRWSCTATKVIHYQLPSHILRAYVDVHNGLLFLAERRWRRDAASACNLYRRVPPPFATHMVVFLSFLTRASNVRMFECTMT